MLFTQSFNAAALESSLEPVSRVPVLGDEIGGDDEDEDSFQASPVEIGPAGIIRKENEYRSIIELKHPVHLHALLESRYITEGRDNLQGHSLISASTELSISNLTFAPWLAHSPQHDYEELNLNFIYGIKLSSNIELYATYSYLHAWEGSVDEGDNELGFELAFAVDDLVNISAGWVHSTTADGNYFEVALRQDHTIDSGLTLNGGVIIGINQGYIIDGHTGVDHALLRIGLAFHPWEQLELVAYISHSHAINEDPQNAGDSSLRNYNMGGVGLTYRF